MRTRAIEAVRAGQDPGTDGLDQLGAHGDIRWPEGARLDKIARVVDLSRDHRLGGAAEVRIGFVLPAFDRGARSQVLRPLTTLGRNNRFEPRERHTHESVRGVDSARPWGPIGHSRRRQSWLPDLMNGDGCSVRVPTGVWMVTAPDP